MNTNGGMCDGLGKLIYWYTQMPGVRMNDGVRDPLRP